MLSFRTALPVLGPLFIANVLLAQTVSSTLKGTVQDTSGAVVATAACRLTNLATNAIVSVVTASDGAFQFLDVLPGNYTLSVIASGFKKYELNGIEILASEFRSAGNIVLEIGQATETLVVAEST